MIHYDDIIKAEKMGYFSDYETMLFARAKGKIKSVTGVLPLTFTAKGGNAADWVIYGNAQGVGEQRVDGYYIPLTNTGKNLWQKSEAPGYDYSTDYKKYNANKAVTLSAGTYTLSSDGRLPLIQVFTSELIQVVPANSVISYPDGTYSLVWDDYALWSPVPSTTKVVTITLLQDAVLTFATVSDIGTYLLINKGDTVLRADYPLYIGDSPLTEGETVSKTSTGVDIELFEGENTVSTTLYNKPEMKIEYE